MGKFRLLCVEGGELLQARGFMLRCPGHGGLLRSVYSEKKLRPASLPGIWRFICWLPVNTPSSYGERPLTYRSEGLAEELGLENLYIVFNGYWPERGTRMETCTFKELEAAVTVQYAREAGVGRLVVASAGNTAKAFAAAASEERFPVVLVVPKKCLCGVFLPRYDRRYVRTVMISDGDYSDSIALAKRLSRIRGFTYEGGARNVARRDGLGTVLLEVVAQIGQMPRHYFQAVGSGTGAIAAYEAALRLLEDGRFGRVLPRLHLAQNLPVAPMYSAWREGRREILPGRDIPRVENVLDLLYARVLSNRYPPYGVAGGVYDALRATRGEMYGVRNSEARRARALFSRAEGVDILPAAAVAVAALVQAVEEGRVGREEVVLLNITGGGSGRLRKDKKLRRLREDCTLSRYAGDDELEELEL
ncbi:MAG: cysteate synthase [Euryarchaeota archaeon]|nr:cysteate synthase [Euryarchaeota archaeon]